MRRLRIALAQINPTVGDLDGNTRLILGAMENAAQAGADVVAFPELAVTGYPPEDLLFKRQFLDETDRHLAQIAAAAGDTMAVVGAPRRADGNLYNTAAVVHRGKLVTAYRKVFLPNYGVFDEHRYFARGRACPIITLKGVRLGVCVCEDIWFQPNPATIARAGGAEIVLNINGSPYHRGKGPRAAGDAGGARPRQ